MQSSNFLFRSVFVWHRERRGRSEMRRGNRTARRQKVWSTESWKYLQFIEISFKEHTRNDFITHFFVSWLFLLLLYWHIFYWNMKFVHLFLNNQEALVTSLSNPWHLVLGSIWLDRNLCSVGRVTTLIINNSYSYMFKWHHLIRKGWRRWGG